MSSRVRLILVLVAGGVALALVAMAGEGATGSAGTYQVDAIFDVARGIGPQQVVKIAGAQVGTVTAVRLTSAYKARVEMSIDRRFAPFRADASCRIEPEGIISENFVGCSPGTPSAPVLAADRSGTPTVPVRNTTEPISLQDLFNIWSTPVSERLSVLLDELGIGVSGRADDIQAILGRANPALTAARRAIGLVNRQRVQLQRLVVAAAPVVGQLAHHDQVVQRFLDAGASLTTITAEHRDALSAAIARLPALLHSAQPALAQLAAVGLSAPPLLAEVRAAAPAITRLTETIPPFSGQAIDTLTALSPSLARTGSALGAATPTLRRLQRFAVDADPAGASLDRLLVSLRDSGAIESLLRGLYNGAALTSHYDANSHVIFADMLSNQCLEYATVASSACDAHLNGSATIPGEPNARRGHRRHARRRVRRAPDASASTSVAKQTITRPTPARPSLPAPVLPGGSSVPEPLQHLLDYLLR